SCPCSERRWVLRATDGRAAGRLLWRQPMPAWTNNWSILWRTLRARVPDGVYREGAPVAAVDGDAAGATIELEDGSAERFDVAIGADGYRSLVRERIHPGRRPTYAGYVLWRGNYEESRLSDLDQR